MEKLIILFELIFFIVLLAVAIKTGDALGNHIILRIWFKRRRLLI